MAFWCVRPPGSLIARIDHDLQKLRLQCLGVHWVAPEDFHITVKFFRRDLISKNIATHLQSMEAMVSTQQAFEVRLGCLDSFQDAQKRDRVLFLSVSEGTEQICSLSQKVDNVLKEQLKSEESQVIIPHLTIGRVFDHKVFDRSFLDRYPKNEDLRFKARSLDLMDRKKGLKNDSSEPLYRQWAKLDFMSQAEP